MKKVFACVLAVVLLFSLTGCGLLDELNPGRKNEDDNNSGSSNTVDPSLLWSALNGVWISEDGVFIWFWIFEDGSFCYTTGMMFSGYVMNGTLEDAAKTGNDGYTLSISFPAVEPGEENSGRDAFTADISITTNLSGYPKTIDAADIATDGSVRTFTYSGRDLDEASGSAELPGQDGGEGMAQAEAWERYSGIWAYKSDGIINFAFFSEYDGTFSIGTLFSGYSAGGQLTYYEDEALVKTLKFSVFQPAYETAESSAPEMEFSVAVDYSSFGDGILYISIGESSYHAYRYIARDFTGIGDMEHVLAQLPED